jgi:hypothetical protein
MIPVGDEAPATGTLFADPVDPTAGADATGADATGADDSPAIGALDGETTRPRADLDDITGADPATELTGEPGKSTADEATSAGAETPEAEAVR